MTIKGARVAVLIDEPPPAGRRRCAATAVASLKNAGLKAWMMGASGPVTRLVRRLKRQRPDVVLLDATCYGNDNGARLVALLDLLQIPFVGATILPRLLKSDVDRWSRLLQSAGLATIQHSTVGESYLVLIDHHAHVFDLKGRAAPEPIRANALTAAQVLGVLDTMLISFAGDPPAISKVETNPSLLPGLTVAETLRLAGLDPIERLVNRIHRCLSQSSERPKKSQIDCETIPLTN